MLTARFFDRHPCVAILTYCAAGLVAGLLIGSALGYVLRY